MDRTPDGFKVQMPADIKQIQVPAYNEQGGAEQVDMIYAYPDSETCFSVAWADNPPVERANFNAPDRTLDMARDDAMARTQTTLVEESAFSQQGFPGRYFSSRNLGGGVMNSRLSSWPATASTCSPRHSPPPAPAATKTWRASSTLSPLLPLSKN